MGNVGEDHQLLGFSDDEISKLNRYPYSDILINLSCWLVCIFDLLVSLFVLISISSWEIKVFPIVFFVLTLIDVTSTTISLYFPNINFRFRILQGIPSIIIDLVWTMFNLFVTVVSYVYLLS